MEKAENTQMYSHLFEGWEETMIWSCLDGVMGEIYTDDIKNPLCAAAFIGGFVFFAGVPSMELVRFKPETFEQKEVILVGQTKEWDELIRQHYGKCAKEFTRYAFVKDSTVFDVKHLTGLVQTLPKDFRLQLIDEIIYQMCLAEEWARDLVANFRDYEEFSRLGLGVVALYQGQIVAGASSYTSYRGGIEIEVDTKENFRRQGLAKAVSAKLILECLSRGLYPSWDAHNLQSADLAKKLGYLFSHEYLCFEVEDF